MGAMKIGTHAPLLDRREAVSFLLARRGEALVVAGTGGCLYDVAASGDLDCNFYMWGGMGLAATLALGVALARPSMPVVCFTGDGDMLMGLGSLATIGAEQPRNLHIVVIDNGHYGETGMQESHTSHGVNLTSVARGCGISRAMQIHEHGDLVRLADQFAACDGPTFACVHVGPEEHKRVLPWRDGPALKDRFAAYIVRAHSATAARTQQ